MKRRDWDRDGRGREGRRGTRVVRGFLRGVLHMDVQGAMRHV